MTNLESPDPQSTLYLQSKIARLEARLKANPDQGLEMLARQLSSFQDSLESLTTIATMLKQMELTEYGQQIRQTQMITVLDAMAQTLKMKVLLHQLLRAKGGLS